MKTIVSILEARTQAELKIKTRAQEKGLHEESYFNFNLFVEQFFAKTMPQQLKREKFVFNFLWSLAHLEENNHLVDVFVYLLKGEYLTQDLSNLLMVKDFVKHHLIQKAKMQYADLTEQGSKFEHSDSLIGLVRHIVLNYDPTFKVIYEEKFLQVKGDIEYMTLFEFVGAAAKAFHELRLEGHIPKLKEINLYSPSKTRNPQASEDHMLKCFGFTGKIQDRSKMSKQDLKWFLWSDYSQKNARQKELSMKEVGDFFSIDLDQKVQTMKQMSAQKSKRACSPVPYKNLTERTKNVIEDLDLNVPGRSAKSKQVGFMDRNLSEKDETEAFLSKFKAGKDHDLILFERFDRMPKDMRAGLQEKSVMQALKDYEKLEKKADILKEKLRETNSTKYQNQNMIKQTLEEKLHEVSNG